MNETPPDPGPAPAPVAGGGFAASLFRPTARAVMQLVTAVVLLVLVARLPGETSSGSHSVQMFAEVVTLLAAGAMVVHQYRNWKRPTREMVALLAEIRAGEAPIDEVRKVGRGVAQLGPVLAEVLHELRQKEQELARLEAEMSQRVASRTDALERSLSSMKNQAERDQLTGLYNRRALDHAFPKVLEQCRAAGANLCLVMIDLDRFKSVNDTLGHQAGDTLIADVGALIRSTIRQGDLAFRYGGDEFAILLPNTDRPAAQTLADRLVSLGAQLGQTLKVRPAPGLSAGLATLAENPTATVEEFMRAADRKLYAEKVARKSA